MSADCPAPEEAAHQLALADAGELAGPLAHEVNNFLNVVLLQLAILEQTLPAASSDLAEVRRQGKQLAELVKQWQRARRLPAAEARRLDLNEILQHVAANVSGGSDYAAVRLVLTPRLAPIMAIGTDVQRLCLFLLKNAISAAGQGQAQVCVRTEPANGFARLRVEDTGPGLSPESLADFFEPTFTGRPGMDHLEIAACRGIVRRLNGKIYAENLPSGGIAVVVELPLA
jgi:signal transduction histidine kinase